MLLLNLIPVQHYMKVPNRNRILESLLSDNIQLGKDRSTIPQTVIDQQQSRGERETETTSVSRAVPQHNTNGAEQQQKERVTEVYVPDENEKVDTDGIYDVPSSVLRSVHDIITEEQGSEYDQLIPVSAHTAKIADEHQKTLPSQSGWGYAEIKDVGPSVPTASAQVIPSHQGNTHSTSKLQYADINDAVPSKQAPVVKQAPYAHDTDSTIDVQGSLMAPQSTEEQVMWASVMDSENMQHMQRKTSPSSSYHELEQSSEISELEDGRNTVTPEGSEGSDVFMEQSPIAMTTKSNSLPSRVSHQTQSAGVGNAISPRRGTSVKSPSPRHNRSRIVSEPQPTTKPRPAKRTRVSNDPSPQALPERSLPQLSETQPLADLQPEMSPPALPEKPQPPPVLPEKPLPELPEKPSPAPALPEKPVPVLPEKPPPELPPPLPEKPPSELPSQPLPDRPPPLLPDKPPLVLQERPVWGKPAAPVPPQEQPMNAAERSDNPLFGKSPPKVLERPPIPKPRRHIQSTGGSTPVQVRSSRSHTTATCNTTGLDSTLTPPSTYQSQETNGGSPKAFRSTRAKSSSDSQRLEISNGSGVHGQNPQHSPELTTTVAYENAIFFKGKAKAAAPPVARKPKHTPTSSPGPAFNRREHSGPKTSPKPKRN